MSYLAMPDGTKIYHESRGDGEAILFVHGLNSSHFELREFIDEFKSDHRCIAYDQRGHGASDRPKIHLNVRTLGQDMNELIECLDLRDLTVIGHSMGAAASLKVNGRTRIFSRIWIAFSTTSVARTGTSQRRCRLPSCRKFRARSRVS